MISISTVIRSITTTFISIITISTTRIITTKILTMIIIPIIISLITITYSYDCHHYESCGWHSRGMDPGRRCRGREQLLGIAPPVSLSGLLVRATGSMMMEKSMEATIVYWGSIGTMEKNMEANI